jgi:hypothetical protein
MPSPLAQLEARVAARLSDAANTIFSTATIDEALRSALHDYSAISPLTMATYLVAPASGREIALNGLADLLNVSGVWWPYDTTTETWPPNQVTGWRVVWEDAQPVLFLSAAGGAQPQANDKIRVWYTKPHTIQNLDGASTTSLPGPHESGLVNGAAGYAALSENMDQIGAIHLDPTESLELRQWAGARLKEFQVFLAQVRSHGPTPGPSFGGGWSLDKYDLTRR